MSRGDLSAATIDTHRGQAYIAEALFAVVLLAGVMFVVTTALTVDEPALSTEERATQAQIEADAHNLIEQSKQEGSLKASILNWDDDNQRYWDEQNNTGSDGNYIDYPPGLFGDRLRALQAKYPNRVVVSNVKIIPSQNGSQENFKNQRPESYPFVDVADASNKMVTVDTHITLYGDDQFLLPPRAHRTEPTQEMGENEERKLHELDEDDEFPIPPATDYDEVDEDDVYNVVNVRVVLWEFDQ